MVLSDTSNQLFSDTVPVTLLQPGTSGPEYNSCNIDVILKIVERRHENNEKEFRIEISRPDEFEFLYAEGITRGKFQSLAKTWNLNVDFEDFPKRIIRLLKEREARSFPISLNCTLCQDHTICIFEIIRQIDMQTVRMPIELRAVRGEDLMCHAMNNLRQLKKQVSELLSSTKEVEKLRDKYRQLEEEYDNYKQLIEGERAELERRLHETEWRADEGASKIDELENDLQLERDEHDAAKSIIDKLRGDLITIEDKMRILEEDLDYCEVDKEALEEKLKSSEELVHRLRMEKDSLKEEIEILEKKLKKGNYVLGTYIKENTRSFIPKSCDEKKLSELEADLKEKNLLIDNMTGVINDYKKKADDLLVENSRLKATLEDMENREQRNNRVLGMYRNGLSPGSLYPNLAATAGLPRVIGSPLISTTPSTPAYRPVLGRSLQTCTALTTPSLRNTPPGLPGRLLTTLGKENVTPPAFQLEPPSQPQPSGNK